jgi:hypothetical protein
MGLIRGASKTNHQSNPENQKQVKKKKFKIGAPSNYDRIKSKREKKKLEKDKPRIYEPPEPQYAFEILLKRSKRLKEFFFSLEKEEVGLSFCRNNWHFGVTFESFLVTLVKEGEITKEFNQLNRKTADRIEKFIKERVEKHFDYLKNEERLKSKAMFN